MCNKKKAQKKTCKKSDHHGTYFLREWPIFWSTTIEGVETDLCNDGNAADKCDEPLCRFPWKNRDSLKLGGVALWWWECLSLGAVEADLWRILALADPSISSSSLSPLDTETLWWRPEIKVQENDSLSYHWKKISWNQLFSKTVDFTNFSQISLISTHTRLLISWNLGKKFVKSTV